MREILPYFAALGIGVPIAAKLELAPIGSGIFCIGLYSLLKYFGD